MLLFLTEAASRERSLQKDQDSSSCSPKIVMSEQSVGRNSRSYPVLFLCFTGVQCIFGNKIIYCGGKIIYLKLLWTLKELCKCLVLFRNLWNAFYFEPTLQRLQEGAKLLFHSEDGAWTGIEIWYLLANFGLQVLVKWLLVVWFQRGMTACDGGAWSETAKHFHCHLEITSCIACLEFLLHAINLVVPTDHLLRVNYIHSNWIFSFVLFMIMWHSPSYLLHGLAFWPFLLNAFLIFSPYLSI